MTNRCSNCIYFVKKTNRGGECHKLYYKVFNLKANSIDNRRFTVMKYHYCKLHVEKL